MNNLIMKTLRFLGMTLLMVMLAANFTACGDDEDEIGRASCRERV